MSDINKINTNNTISYNVTTIKTPVTTGQIYHPIGFININDIKDKYANSFKGQPPGTGA